MRGHSELFGGLQLPLRIAPACTIPVWIEIKTLIKTEDSPSTSTSLFLSWHDIRREQAIQTKVKLALSSNTDFAQFVNCS